MALIERNIVSSPKNDTRYVSCYSEDLRFFLTAAPRRPLFSFFFLFIVFCFFFFKLTLRSSASDPQRFETRTNGADKRSISNGGQDATYTLTFDLDAIDATWDLERTVRVPKNASVKNLSSGSSSTFLANVGLNLNPGPTRKGYVFAGWYTEAGEDKQNETTRFKFEDENEVAPTLVTSDLRLHARWLPATLESVAKLGKLPKDLRLYDEATQSALGPYDDEAAAGASVSAIFVTMNGGSDASKRDGRDGKSWATAWAGTELKEKLDGINDASKTKVYLFFVAVGEYRAPPSFRATTQNPGWLSMKDYVTIVGGWEDTGGGGSWKGGPSYVTNLMGGKTENKKYSVIYNKNIKDKATLVNVTISDGNAFSDGGGMSNVNSSPTLANVTFTGNVSGVHGRGGGMGNSDRSSPTLVNVSFSGNAGNVGGGMFNGSSSPTLVNVSFSGNHADIGGGMYNYNSAPILMGAMFTGNSSSHFGGGGMHNYNSAPVLMGATFTGNSSSHFGGGGMSNSNHSAPTLVNVTFTANSAKQNGAGMLNYNSAPILTGVTFMANTAGQSGGGMYNDNNGKVVTVVNSLFWGNTAKGKNQGAQIYMQNDKNGGAEKLSLYNCIVENGLGSLAPGSTSTSVTNPLTLTSLLNLTVKDGFGGIGVGAPDPNKGAEVSIHYENVYGANALDNPSLSTLNNYGGSVQTIPIAQDSFAINKGLYLRLAGLSLYYSEDNSNWFVREVNTNIHAPSTKRSATLPQGAIDLTATDARGFARLGRPDIGAFEFGATASTP